MLLLATPNICSIQEQKRTSREADLDKINPVFNFNENMNCWSE